MRFYGSRDAGRALPWPPSLLETDFCPDRGTVAARHVSSISIGAGGAVVRGSWYAISDTTIKSRSLGA